MGSRHLLQEQNRGDQVVGVMKQKAAVPAAGQNKSRRALGDIGNMVTIRPLDGKQLPAITRPVTRSFCAQLLANAQKDAAEKKKKPLTMNVDNNRVVPKKKLPVKPKAQPVPDNVTVIEISPDTEERQKPESSQSKRNKKPQSSLTSTLTARSKAACGLNYKPKPKNIIDIDAEDVGNELAEVEYVEDIYKFYKLVENESRVHDYIHSQPEINDKMRAILVDWLIEVHNKFELTNETLYLTINIVDRFLAAETVARRELQCVGMSAMLIASKYEEIWAPEVNDLVQISDRAYEHRHVLVMEKRILGRLEWNLTVPTPYVFLVRFIKAAATPLDTNMENMVYFYAELGMMNYEVVIRFCPSMVAAAAVYAARATLNSAALTKSEVWHETLEVHTGFTEREVMECAKRMVVCHSMAVTDEKRRVIYRKYSNVSRGAVALYPPAKDLLTAALTL
ncbi:putative cyclin domain-containing protein [Helianthus annuus]|uniref:Cyclin B3, G2/mitotic-specific, Cyclin-like superfamily n=1 Tax=Helianthus annuus TaxID=4232 RepID=A0A251VLL8_HELAN|nr:G2/mitotic-specific cyclin S13-7 [Helianthus annuus]KAF5821156.1 putative cyclin B3, G2/mitotic-specific, Cyclin-like superfamily [Helianthus annuus]KAJ0626119.1 putative cyclin domain-containing protein [Helianthus annuus]KAJ0782452.1 putative cyclin domain-containing protein [Helianthus annuus]KAJ0947057.1 putative cyclin domain-containing protein [Helianthus annuus]